MEICLKFALEIHHSPFAVVNVDRRKADAVFWGVTNAIIYACKGTDGRLNAVHFICLQPQVAGNGEDIYELDALFTALHAHIPASGSGTLNSGLVSCCMYVPFLVKGSPLLLRNDFDALRSRHVFRDFTRCSNDKGLAW